MSLAFMPNARWDLATPRLSVLTPFFRDDPRPLIAALAEEAAGLDGAVELVLLDDRGGDDALSRAVGETLAPLPIPAALVTPAANAGRAKGRNHLASAARARHLLFVDSDMLPDAPDFLRRWLEQANAGTAVAFGGFSLDQARPRRDQRLHYALQLGGDCLPASARAKAPGKYVTTSNLLVRRDVLEAEAFDERFSGWGWEDTEWGARVAARYGVVHLDNAATHLGLDTAAGLAAKYEQSGANFARLHALHPQMVGRFGAYRAARMLRRAPGRRSLRAVLKRLALSETAPMRARTLAMRLYRAALYAEVLA